MRSSGQRRRSQALPPHQSGDAGMPKAIVSPGHQPSSAPEGGHSGHGQPQHEHGDLVLELVAVLFGGNAGVEADRDPARIGELAVPAHLRADRGPFGLDNAASARDLREDAF
jgi:hypothetical protein